MPRELLLVRHCKSSWKDATLTDRQRPLTQRGKRDAEAVGREIERGGLLPDVILSSPAKRARSTVKRLTRGWASAPPVRVVERLYHTSPVDLLAEISQLDRDCHRAMIVGHNPTLEELLALLVGGSVSMPTGSVAHVVLEATDWAEVDERTRGRLRQLLSPPAQEKRA